MNILQLPFNKLLGFSLVERQGCSELTLAPRKDLQNHLGAIHAAAVYALAEAASGHALLEQCGVCVETAMALLRSSKVKYRSPATARLTTATSVAQETIDTFKQRFNERGRALIEVEVQVLSPEGQVTLDGRYTWFISQRNSE